jgi:gamma-glutamyltranspeptidase/glutathione hydrolase
MCRFARVLLVALGLLVTTGSLSRAYDRITGREFASRSEVIAPHGMVATSQPLVTQIALQILKDGGAPRFAAIAPTRRSG